MKGQLPTPEGCWLEMVVSMQGLTSLRDFASLPVSGYKNVQMRDLVLFSSAEPLNATPEKAKPDSAWRRSLNSDWGARNRENPSHGAPAPVLAERAECPSIPPTVETVGFLEVFGKEDLLE